MTRLMKWMIVGLLVISTSYAEQPSWYSQEEGRSVKINVLLFLSSTCPHCQQAESFFNTLGQSSSEISLTKYFINQDKQALFLFSQLLDEAQKNDFTVPSIYFCNSRWVGFSDAQQTGKDLLRAIDYCKTQIEKEGRLTSTTVNTLKRWAYANRFDAGLVENPAPWRYIVSVAALDAVAPCSFFVLICFLASIGIARDKKTACWGGAFFLVAMLCMHYLQQTQASFFYQALPWLRIPALFVGLLVLYYVYPIIFAKLQDKKQTFLYACVVLTLGFLVTAYQQTCLMNWAYVYQQWFNNQNFPTFHAVFYQLMYQVVYALPLLLCGLMYFFAFLRLRLFSALMLGFCALLLLVAPQTLSILWLSFAVVGLSLLGNYFLKRA